jgi:hypothetical protein
VERGTGIQKEMERLLLGLNRINFFFFPPSSLSLYLKYAHGDGFEREPKRRGDPMVQYSIDPMDDVGSIDLLQ